ncbi:MAG: BatA domain-containing protein, partial [Planctomycetaceae bacterium]
MQLINPALLFGLGLAAVPVVLHLLLKARPKPYVFPALRLLAVRRRHNTRRLRLRHLWLLLLRMALIALVVMAVARPKLPAADYWPRWPGETLGLLAVFAIPLLAYMAVIGYWRKRGWPGHVLA